MNADQKTPSDFDAEIEAQIETEIAAGLAADRAKRREELIYQARRKIAAADYDRINRKHPIENKYGGLTPEQYAERLRQMDARAKADFDSMDEANRRWAEREAAERKAEAARRGPKMQVPGSEGFRIKPIGT